MQGCAMRYTQASLPFKERIMARLTCYRTDPQRWAEAKPTEFYHVCMPICILTGSNVTACNSGGGALQDSGTRG